MAPTLAHTCTQLRCCHAGGSSSESCSACAQCSCVWPSAKCETVLSGQPTAEHFCTAGRVWSSSKSRWHDDGRTISARRCCVCSVFGGQSVITSRRPVSSATWKLITIDISLLPMPVGDVGAK
eukprot:6880158-Prymnesium_polylepis.1